MITQTADRHFLQQASGLRDAPCSCSLSINIGVNKLKAFLLHAISIYVPSKCAKYRLIVVIGVYASSTCLPTP